MPNLFSKISLYWYCQFLGWGSATLYWAYYTLDDPVHWSITVVGLLVSFLFMIANTHLYKKIAHHYKWHQLELGKLLPIMLLGTLVLAFNYTVVSYVVCAFKFGAWIGTTALLGMITGGLRYNAIWLLIFHLYHYAKRESNFEMQKLAYEKLATEAQLSKLNTELNPHFLFNSLNSIKALILEDPKAARRALVLLSDMLRYSLQLRDKDNVTLEEELVQVEDLLQMEKIRFGERLHFDLEVEENSRKAIILPLSLHTLVENAIKHGISTQIAGGQVAIKTSIVEDQLLLEVTNDGQLRQANKGQGIGLSNLRKRLALYFANQAQFSIRDLSNNKVKAILKTPLQYA